MLLAKMERSMLLPYKKIHSTWRENFAGAVYLTW